MSDHQSAVDLGADVDALRHQMQALLMATALDGDTASLQGPLQTLRELIDDTLLDVEDPAAAPIFTGWAAAGYAEPSEGQA